MGGYCRRHADLPTAQRPALTAANPWSGADRHRGFPSPRLAVRVLHSSHTHCTRASAPVLLLFYINNNKQQQASRKSDAAEKQPVSTGACRNPWRGNWGHLKSVARKPGASDRGNWGHLASKRGNWGHLTAETGGI